MTETSDPTAALIATRGQTHGSYSATAQCAQLLKRVIAGQTPEGKSYTYIQQESLDMICNKLGRIVAGDPDFRDHWDDIAGYARLVADRCSK